jgi:Tfp pilus assembly ATPase PilU
MGSVPHPSVAERLAKLAPDQRAAATAEDGPVLCVAPAGSGKTTTLVGVAHRCNFSNGWATGVLDAHGSVAQEDALLAGKRRQRIDEHRNGALA